jgi:hypothetical protein
MCFVVLVSGLISCSNFGISVAGPACCVAHDFIWLGFFCRGKSLRHLDSTCARSIFSTARKVRQSELDLPPVSSFLPC